MSDKPLTGRMQMQEAAKKHAAYHKAYPEWIHAAAEALKAWERGDMTLTHAVAAAMHVAYENGRAGDYPEVPQRKPTRMTRGAKAPEPEPPPQRVARRART